MQGLLLLIGLSITAGQADVKDVVSAYWNALAQKDRASALKLVHPDDWNNFLSNQPGPLSSWKIEKVDFESEGRARVTVSGEVAGMDGRYGIPASIIQIWELVDSDWRLRIPVSARFDEVLLKNLKGRSQSSPSSKELIVSAKTLRFHALNPSQPALLSIWNGTQEPASVMGFEIDEALFRAEEVPDTIEPNTKSQITLRYIGEAKERNLTSRAILVLKHADQEKQFEIPIVYNYFDKVAAWVLEQQGTRSGQGKQPQAAKPPRH